MAETEIAVDDVVQIDPNTDGHFGGCLMVVESVRSWGVVGFIPAPKGAAYLYRAKVGTFECVGRVVWAKGEQQDG